MTFLLPPGIKGFNGKKCLEAYLGLCQTSLMDLFIKTVTVFYTLIILVKKQGPKYTTDILFLPLLL